jgi:two-component system response regulator FixJ
MQQAQTVFIVDDDESIRKSMCFLMKSAGLHAQSYGNANAFLDCYRSDLSGCLVVDIRMPGMSGLELQRELNRQGSRLPLIIVTGHGDIAMAVQAMKEGAVDFIEKPFDDEVMLNRIQECLKSYAQSQEEQQKATQWSSRVAALTPREKEVMTMLAEGKANKVIANELGISSRTIEAHRARIMEKLEVGSLADIVRISMIMQ